MNLFVLDRQPHVAAQYHCDKHVVKMVLETAQLLSTAKHEFGLDSPYRPTHKNHPCSVWVRQSRENYYWAWNLGYALGVEYTHRYGKVHKSWLLFSEGKLDLPDDMDLPEVLAMPDEYKDNDPVEAYRRYYIGEKASLFKFTGRQKPEWI
jgi:hypothetical protein